MGGVGSCYRDRAVVSQVALPQVLELGADGRYVHALAAADGVVTRVPGAEGLTLHLDALWSEVERLGPESGEGTLAPHGNR